MTNVIGSGGGGKGKRGSSTATETANNMFSKQTVYIKDGWSEGPIGGLVNGQQSIYLDSTPLQNPDLSFNFRGIGSDVRNGFPFGNSNQTPMGLFGPDQTGTPVNINTLVTRLIPVVHTTSGLGVDAMRLIIELPALAKSDTKGNISGNAVSLLIESKLSSSSVWSVAKFDTISGKSSSTYQRSYIIDGTAHAGALWDIRVTRLSADPVSIKDQNRFILKTVVEVLFEKFEYPDTAYIGMKFDASMAGDKVPNRSYELNGLHVRVPTNLNTTTRVFTGIWGGLFKIAWTDDPAWILYDLLTNTRYGLGIPASMIAIGDFYSASIYNSASVQNGVGGVEPRFSCSIYGQNYQDAYKLLNAIVSSMRGGLFWAAGVIRLTQDRPADPVRIFSQSEVVDGMFTYQTSSLKARHTVAKVSWNDPVDHYKLSVEYVENTNSIKKYGVNEIDVVAFGTTSRGQAHRYGKWVLATEELESMTVQFTTGMRAAIVFPGEIIRIQDKDFTNVDLAGRIVSGTTNSITLDRPVTLQAGRSYFASVILSTGVIERHAIAATSITSLPVTSIALSTALSSAPIAGATFIIDGTLAGESGTLWRVVSVSESTDGVFNITALQHDPQKYAVIDSNIKLTVPTITSLDNLIISPPSNPTHTIESYTNATTNTTNTRASITWTKPAVGTALYYETLYSINAIPFTTAAKWNNENAFIDSVNISTIEIQIVAVGPTGLKSLPLVYTFNIAKADIYSAINTLNNLRLGA